MDHIPADSLRPRDSRPVRFLSKIMYNPYTCGPLGGVSPTNSYDWIVYGVHR